MHDCLYSTLLTLTLTLTLTLGILLRYAYELQIGSLTGNETDNEIVGPLQYLTRYFEP